MLSAQYVAVLGLSMCEIGLGLGRTLVRSSGCGHGVLGSGKYGFNDQQNIFFSPFSKGKMKSAHCEWSSRLHSVCGFVLLCEMGADDASGERPISAS